MNWRADIKKKFANFMVTALGAELGKFDSWNSQQANHSEEETKPNLVIYFEYSEIGEGFAYLTQTEMQAVKRIPVQVTLHVVFNQYSGLNQDYAYDYADKLTNAIVGSKDDLISGKIMKVSETEDVNHKANYDYQIAFGFWIKEQVFKAVSPVDAQPLAVTIVPSLILPVPPEPVYPAKLDDARAWYDYLDPGVVKDGLNAVSIFNDKNPEGNDLLQALGAKQTLWTVNGILWDGIQQFMKTLPFTLTQPTFIYLVFKQVTWSSNDVFCDGLADLKGTVYQQGTSPKISQYNGGAGSANANAPINTYFIGRFLFDGVSSTSQVNETLKVTSSLGTISMDGVTFGARASEISNANIEVKGGVIFDETFNALPTPTEEQAIYDYLNDYYSLGL